MENEKKAKQKYQNKLKIINS